MDELWHVSGGTVTVRELALRTITTLRLRKPSRNDLAAIGGLIGAVLPTVPNRAVGEAPRVIWIGPDEWLIIGDNASSAAIEMAARDAAVALCVSVGDGRCSFEVTGADAAELLAKGTSLDLHPDVFTGDMSAMTLFAQVNAMIDRPPGLAGFRLIFDISLRGYVQTWFREAVVEFT